MILRESDSCISNGKCSKLFKGSETDICLIVQRPIHVPRRQKGKYWVADECKMINTKIVELG